MDVVDNIGGKSFCALADGAVGCVRGAVGNFRDEFEAGCKGIPAWQLLPYERSTIFSAEDMGSGVSSEFGVKA